MSVHITDATPFIGFGHTRARRGALVVGCGTFAAFSGAWAATRHLDKLTLTAIRSLVAALMCLIGLALCAGVLG